MLMMCESDLSSSLGSKTDFSSLGECKKLTAYDWSLLPGTKITHDKRCQEHDALKFMFLFRNGEFNCLAVSKQSNSNDV